MKGYIKIDTKELKFKKRFAWTPTVVKNSNNEFVKIWFRTYVETYKTKLMNSGGKFVELKSMYGRYLMSDINKDHGKNWYIIANKDAYIGQGITYPKGCIHSNYYTKEEAKCVVDALKWSKDDEDWSIIYSKERPKEPNPSYDFHPEHQYLALLGNILTHGKKVSNRTGVDTYRVLGRQMHFDFEDGFPLLTTKKVWLKGVVGELLWFLKGDTNIKFLVDNGINIWNDDAYRMYKQKLKEFNPKAKPESKKWFLENVESESYMHNYIFGDLGPSYGKQWREFESGGEVIDQIKELINGLKNNPNSRRHILTAWNPIDVLDVALPPCHYTSLFSISDDKLHCAFNMRSTDVGLGLPFNIASYGLLTYVIAHLTGYEPGSLCYWGWDIHIYENQTKALRKQLKRKPYPFPTLKINPKLNLSDIENCQNVDEFIKQFIELKDYKCHPSIKMPLST